MAKILGLVSLIFICIFLIGVTCADISPGLDESSRSVDNSDSDIDESLFSLPLSDRISNMTNFVKEGAVYAKNTTKEDVLENFNNLNGEFVQGEQYIFAYDYNGTTLARAYQPDLIGKNRKDMVDSNGMAFFELLADVARYGGGYLYYVYPNPDQNMTEQVKLVYVESIDDTWFIGSGIYLPHIHAKMEEDAISELIDRVLKSVEFAKIEGKEKASSVFNDINSTWAKDSSYIFAYDFTGATLAMPYQPEAIGEDRWEYTDRYGSPIARLEIDVAKRGGGFVYVVYYNPDTKRDELKLCYVLPVDNDWLVGSGLYTGDDLSVDSLSG